MKKNKNKTYKKKNLYGGNIPTPIISSQLKDKSQINLGNFEIMNKLRTLLSGLFLNATESMAKLTNVNLNDSSSIDEKLNKIKLGLSNPVNKEKLRQIIGELAQNGTIAIEASVPFITEFVKKSISIGSNSLSDIGEAIVKVMLNTAEEIPGVGIMIGMIRSFSNVGEAVVSSINAGSEIVTASSQAIDGSIQNFKRISKENGNRMSDVNESINNFTQPLSFNPSSTINSYSPQQLLTNAVKRGGKIKKRTRKYKSV
jgi:hypothetical protein